MRSTAAADSALPKKLIVDCGMLIVERNVQSPPPPSRTHATVQQTITQNAITLAVSEWNDADVNADALAIVNGDRIASCRLREKESAKESETRWA